MRRKRQLLLEPTIPRDAGDRWDYPVVSHFETFTLKTKSDKLEIYYCLQDGIPVGGVNYQYAKQEDGGPGGGGCYPGRKWGEYRTLDDVITHGLIENRHRFKRADMLKLIDDALASRPGTQLQLQFNTPKPKKNVETKRRHATPADDQGCKETGQK